MLVFKNADVAAKYESDFDHDPIIEMGSCTCNYKGPLSGIPLMAAENLIERKSNMIRLKQPTQTPFSEN